MSWSPATSFAHCSKQADCPDVACAKSLYRPATFDRSVIGLSWLTRSGASCQGLTFEPNRPGSRFLSGVHRDSQVTTSCARTPVGFRYGPTTGRDEPFPWTCAGQARSWRWSPVALISWAVVPLVWK